MKCPSCGTQPLVPTRLEADLPALGCKQCSGALLPLTTYRHWSEKQVPESAIVADAVSVEAHDTGKAMLCPKCSRLMLKFRIGQGCKNRVDLCGSCDEAWLDSGEWRLLKQLQLQHQLPKLFTAAWQNRVRQQQSQQNFEQWARDLFKEEFDRVEELRGWLKEHPKRQEILRYLQSD